MGESQGYISATGSMGLSLFSNFRGQLQNTHVQCDTAVQGHPRSFVLVSIERAYETFC